MLKKIFIYNQFILGFLLLGTIISILYLKKIPGSEKQNPFYLRTVGYGYVVYSVNDSYIFTSFEGSGGFLSGGIISKNKIPDINLLTENDISQMIENNSDYVFPCESFSKSILSIGNLDFDKNIEIFVFDFLGTNFLHPIEIDQNGKIREENYLTYGLIRFLVSFWMLPNFIINFLFIIYYLLVCIIYLISIKTI